MDCAAVGKGCRPPPAGSPPGARAHLLMPTSNIIRPSTPLSLEDAIRIVTRYVEHYNQVRLHRAIGYIAPADKLAGREAEIFAARDRKLTEARERTQTVA